MSFPSYANYKPSGVEWLGEVPAHWKLAPLKFSVATIQTGPFGSQLHAEDYVDGGIPVINPSNIQGGVIVADPASSVDEPTANRLSQHKLRSDDLVFGRRGEMGRCAVVGPDQVGWLCGTGSLNVRPSATVRSQFLAYYFGTSGVRDALSLASVGSTMENLNEKILGDLAVPIPPLQEQVSMISFLDRETAKIDALVEEQRKLIALLKEKRQAVISHAVTEGLDPNAPMKDSGIEWLGQVPAHWEVTPIRKAARLESGHTPSRSHPEWWVECCIPWFSLADVWQIRSGGQEYVSETAEKVSELGLANSSARLLPKGTVILSRTASVGYSAIMGVDMATTQDFANWVCGPTLFPEFLLYCLRGMPGEFERLRMGSTHNTIYMPDIASLTIALPPVKEQHAVVAFIRREISRIDALINEAEKGTTLLGERRSALISAAVTGKIDVRGLVQTSEAA